MRVVPIVIRYVLPFIPKFWRRVDDFEARVAVLWMIGEHGEEVPEAPYLLESAVNSYSQVRYSILFLKFMFYTFLSSFLFVLCSLLYFRFITKIFLFLYFA